jgi:hypothetical protein
VPEPKRPGGKTTASSSKTITPKTAPKQVSGSTGRLPETSPSLLKPLLPMFVGLLLLVLGLFWFFSQRSGSLLGQVVSLSNDQVISQFQVQLDDQQIQASNTVTGGVVFSGVKPGKHRLNFQAPGFKRLQHELELKPGEEYRFKVSLKPLEAEVEKPSERKLVLTRRPNQVIVQSADFREQGRVGLAGWPRDLVVYEGLIYIAEYDKDQISEVDPKTWRVSRKLTLARNSGPKRLVLTANNQLLILCEISKELIRVDLQSFNVTSERLSFAKPPLDMALANNSLYLLFSGEVKRLDAEGKSILQEIAIQGIFATQLHYSETDRRFYLLSGRDLLLMSETGQYELVDLDKQPASVLGALGGGQVFLARGKKLWLYDLNTRSVISSSDIELGGEVEWINAGPGSQIVIAQKNPNFLLKGDRASLATMQRQGLEGNPELLKTATF